MEEKKFILVKNYLLVKTKADCEIWCKEGRDKKLTITDTEDGEYFIFMRKDFLYSHSDTTITMCHLLFKGENLESLELEEMDFLPNFTTRKEFIEHKEKNEEYEEQNEKDKEEINKTIAEHIAEFETHKTEFEEHKKSNEEDFENNEKEHKELKDLINNKTCKEIAWSELKTLRDTKSLDRGSWYCIKDYTCVVNSTMTTIKSGNNYFYILVLATSNNTLSETAFASTNPNRIIYAMVNGKKIGLAVENTYFNNCNLDAWELKYCLDNDQTRFPWCGSDDDGGRGVVWYLKDEYGNEAYYDFKNIMEVRYEILNSSNSKSFTKEISRDIWTIDTTNLLYFYTFSYCIDAELTQDKILDLSIQNLASLGTDDVKVNFGNNKLLDNHFINGTISDFSLNCFLVINGVNSSLETLEGFSLRNNKLNGNSFANTFNCLYIYEKTFEINTIGNMLNNSNTNTIDCKSSYNSFNNNNYQIFISSSSSNNTFNNCNYNITIGSNSSNNTFNNCNYNITIGSNSSNNTFNNGNVDITFGIQCINNILGDYNRSLTFGNSNQCNILGNHNYNITMGDVNQYNTIGNGNGYIDFITSGAYGNTGCFIGNNIAGTSGSHKTITSQTNQQYWSL